MNIEIYHLIEGAKRADGLAVIIDVFRAFSMECWLYALGAGEIRPVGSIENTFAWKEKDPDCILVGERQGRKIDGCDLGNSPSSINPEVIRESGLSIRPAPARRESSTRCMRMRSSPAAL